MLKATRLPQGAGLASILLKRACTLELDWDVRQKSRFDALDSLGRPLGVFLPQGTLVRGGDVLLVEDGSMVRVIAAPQAVLRITPCTAHGSPFDLTRAAYQLGHRHAPVELKPDHHSHADSHEHAPQAVQPVAIQIHPRKPHSHCATTVMIRAFVMAHLKTRTGLAESIAFIENRRRPPAV